jgi:hypothetical protein
MSVGTEIYTGRNSKSGIRRVEQRVDMNTQACVTRAQYGSCTLHYGREADCRWYVPHLHYDFEGKSGSDHKPPHIPFVPGCGQAVQTVDHAIAAAMTL